MGLSFYLGSSGSGKSTRLQQDIIEMAMASPKRNHLLIVPDQITMETQKQICNMHPAHGILNIDVLSFSRLAHRIFEEIGTADKVMLDDTGKNLMIRRITQEQKNSLQVMQKNLDQIGYIHEIKSCMSEFMQYGITREDLERCMEYAKGKDLLYHKLQDLSHIYQELKRVLSEKYTTSEEVYLTLKEGIKHSHIIKDCVVAFDGFTGFTPVQNLVIEELIRYGKEVFVSVTIDPREAFYELGGEHNLFYLSQKTICSLEEIAERVQGRVRERSRDIIFRGKPVVRYGKQPELSFLEQSLFRYETMEYEGQVDTISIHKCATREDEVMRVCMEIIQCVREKGYRYSELAVVTGDLTSYDHYIRREFEKYQIPYFLDVTKGILLNPCIEYVKSAIEVVLKGYGYEQMFHYLRSGMVDIPIEEIDELENYVITRGIKGYHRWSQVWECKGQVSEDQIAQMERFNTVRSQIVDSLSGIMTKKQSVEVITRSLYDFVVANQVEEKLRAYVTYFEERHEYSKSKEYAQIYQRFMILLEQIVALMGEDCITLQEYAQILYAGFEEIQIGVIPQNKDVVMIGDIERTRLQEVKTLFFIGVNDGIIPKSTSSGGILSDMEREFLMETKIAMAPTPRQQIYSQKLYLYQNMTKPTQALQVSYASVDGGGKSMRPAYLIGSLCQAYTQLSVKTYEPVTMENVVATKESGLLYTSKLLREYARTGGAFEEKRREEEFCALYQWYMTKEGMSVQLERLLDAAFYEYRRKDLSKEVASLLYGTVLSNSVSRLEQFSGCAYSHFLKYGLKLMEREGFSLERVDIGNVFHGVLELFSNSLAMSQYTWFDFPKEVGEALLHDAVGVYCSEYDQQLFESSARYTYAITRMERIMNRTIQTLQYQLNKGKFAPSEFELSFDRITDLGQIDLSMESGEKMNLRGRIDRLDVCEQENQIQVKVIDYKSSEHTFDLVALYHGLQLQLVVYLNAAVSYQKQLHPNKEVVPAAILYYHMNDPVIDTKGTQLSNEQVEQLIREKLQMKGIVSNDAKIINNLDTTGSAKSDVIPVAFQKDGSIKQSSGVLQEDVLQHIAQYVNHKVKTIGKEIVSGNIEINPYEMDGKSSCIYCAFASICKYDGGMEGYQKRKLGSLSEEEVIERIVDGKWDSTIQ